MPVRPNLVSGSRRASRAAVAVVAVVAAAFAVAVGTGPVLAAGFPIDEQRGGIPTLAPIIEKVTPGVVNIAVSGTVRMQQQDNPLFQDPFFRRFFPEGMQAPRALIPVCGIGRRC